MELVIRLKEIYDHLIQKTGTKLTHPFVTSFMTDPDFLLNFFRQERSVPPKSGTVMTKMLRRFSIDSGGANKANKPNHGNHTDDNV